MIFTLLACLFLGGSLFLFIRNNELFAHGGRHLMHPDALVMLAVIGIPFILVLLHLVRALQQHRRAHTHDTASHPGDG